MKTNAWCLDVQHARSRSSGFAVMDWRLFIADAAEEALHYVAPVGEKAAYVDRAMAAVRPFLSSDTIVAA